MEKHYWTSLAEKEVPLHGQALADQEKKDLESGFTRREFLRLMGASLVMSSAIGCAQRPIEKIIPYLNQPEPIIPGVANWYATTCGECPAACGVLAKTREGRPIKLEGNASHPMNQGGLCARGQASLLNLYDPDRLKNPVRRTGNIWEDLDWGAVHQALSLIKPQSSRVRLLTGHIHSPATRAVIEQFVRTFPHARHVTYEPLSLDVVAQAQERSYGQKVLPAYHFEKASLVVSFGADFLDTYLSPVEFTKKFTKTRQPERKLSRLVVCESVPSLTGFNADQRFPVKAGDELKIALALAHELLIEQNLSGYAAHETVRSFLVPYSVELVGRETGVDYQSLRRLAGELWEHRGNSLVLGGSVSAQGQEGVALNVAANLLNSILGNDGKTVDAYISPSQQSGGRFEDIVALIEEMNRGEVDLLILWKVNPFYTLPMSLGFERAFKKVPQVIAVSDRIDETAKAAHWVLPEPHALESWGDAEPYKGLYSLRQPSIAPLYQTKSFEEILLSWIGGGDWHEFLKDFWRTHIYPRSGQTLVFERFWESVLREGVFEARAPFVGHNPRLFLASALTQLALPQKKGAGLQIIAYPTMAQYDGRSGNNSWLKELPDPVTKITWRNYLSVSPNLASEKGWKEGDILEIKARGLQAELPCHIQPGLHAQTVVVPLGFGRSGVGHVGDNLGVNTFEILSYSHREGLSFQSEVAIASTGRWIKLASTQNQNQLYGRPIIQETTLQAFQKNPEAGHAHEEVLPSMWSPHEYKGHRWGMAIDLTTCTGCSACMLACQVENNVPVVGEERVKQGREMHWIRIDRYYSGSVDNPDAVHQPMLCQHCENAPCETVCPTLATLHDDEGLNVQVYNRCVGTRYCSNNCPYKVRRFNWFEYLWKAEAPLAMTLNPDVSVREKGVMEKCTFCTQRIEEGKAQAKELGRELQDGDIKPACQQSCPADAIVFGDLNNPESRVAKAAKSPRGYHVLAELNVKPSITYMTKVRNKT